MTSEEAIKIIKELPNRILGITLPFDTDFDYTEALSMAIKALDQEPCDDAISRAQALSDYADWFGYGYRDNTFYKRLKNMPSIQPKIGGDC